MPALRFKTCRLLPGNVRNRELSLIQCRILRRLRNKTRSIKRNLSRRENLNSNIKSQTTRKLSLYYGDLPIREMHRGRERTSYIPFLLNQETRSDVIPPISHQRVCLNNGLVTITHLKFSHGDLISFKENDARTRGFEIRRSFYIDISVGKIIGKFLSAISVGKRREQKNNGSAYSQLRGDAAYYSNPRNCKSCVLICKKKTLKEQRSLDPQKYA
ncbi:hypothetical protein VPH35_102012 [Triticum aestivum]